MTLSIIIPTFNEEENIGNLVSYLFANSDTSLVEIIVSDGGSTDNTMGLAQKAGATTVVSPGKGRAAQMNFGASLAKGDVLYFIHADCLPPKTFTQDIVCASENGYGMGRYRTRFDSKKMLLKMNAWFTRFDLFVCMGGDQTLFVKKDVFEKCNGFTTEMRIMEEYEFCERARKVAKYKIIQKNVLISARKYETNSWLRVLLANSKIIRMYKHGATQQAMADAYKQMLDYRKGAG